MIVYVYAVRMEKRAWKKEHRKSDVKINIKLDTQVENKHI